MELYINNTRVDLEKSVPFPLTYQISDIRDTSTRKGNSSKTIAVPGTRVNTKLFASVFSLSTTGTEGNAAPIVYDFDPSIKTPARYYENGLLLFSGVAQLTECTLKEQMWTFSIVLLSDAIDYMSEFKNKKLRELGWSEYNHDLIYDRQQETWSGTIQKNAAPYSNIIAGQWKGEGYYYGLIDYGYDRAAEDAFECDQIPPQVFIKSIVDKMFENTGITYTSNFFSSQLFKKCLMAYEGGVLPNMDAAIVALNSIETDQDADGSGYIINETLAVEPWYGAMFTALTSIPGALFEYYVDYNSITGSEVDTGNHIQTSAPLKFVASSEGDYVLKYSGDHDYNIDFTLTAGSPTVDDYSPEVSSYIDIYINGVQYSSEQLYIDSAPVQSYPFAGWNFTITMAQYEKELYLESSDLVEVKLRFKVTTIVTTEDIPGIEANYTFAVTPTNCELDIDYEQQEIITGANINLKSFLPKMDCATFFKGIINMFNLYVQPDPLDNTNLLIEPLNTFYNGSNSAVNWTDKLDPMKPIKVTPTINFSTKEYIFGFQDDKDYWNERYFTDVTEQYGSKMLTSSSQFATGKTEIKLPFSNKVIGLIPTTDLTVPRNFTVKTDQAGISEITPKRGKPFIVQIKKGNVLTGANMQTGTWNHIDETDTDNAQTEYPYVGHVDDIDDPTFDLMFNLPSYLFYDMPSTVSYTTNNLYLYHEKFIKEILDKNGKMLTAFMNLTPTDINQLDFGDLVNIHGVVYRLQKIENYDSKEQRSTKCEFIRIIEGESIQTNTVEELTPGVPNFDPFDIPSNNNKRITTSNNARTTTDNDTRITN